jgi:hypothetical protein
MGCLMASNQGSDEGGKMHMQGVCRLICTWQHVATPSTPESAQQSSLRAYELTSLRAYELAARAPCTAVQMLPVRHQFCYRVYLREAM